MKKMITWTTKTRSFKTVYNSFPARFTRRTKNVMVIHSKHIPQRMCISCRRSDAKQNLTRMVLTPQGTVEIDHTGKKAGRGAYLCFDRTCWGKIINNKKLESTFKRKLSSMDYRVLLEYINNTDDGVPEREIK